MPELPEVENVRRTLAMKVVGRTLIDVSRRRGDVVRGPLSGLAGSRVVDVARHGKQLAVLTPGPVLCVHLGMTGSLCAAAPGQPARPHTHLVLKLDDGQEIRFADPRRFGGVWVFDSLDDLRCERWSALGPDALTITPAELHERLTRTRRALKAALLDQSLVAGLGNIYVDELLAGVSLHPLRSADTVTRQQAGMLVRRGRALLRRAIEAGGSTLRDYVNANGEAGGFQRRFKVYGRAGRPCRRCGGELRSIAVAQRTTVFCETCQK